VICVNELLLEGFKLADKVNAMSFGNKSSGVRIYENLLPLQLANGI